MPRLTGVRERFDDVLYDTRVVSPGETVRFFGVQPENADPHRTNQREPGRANWDTMVITSIATRLLGKTRAQEDLLLDLVHLELVLGDLLRAQLIGSHASTLMHPYTEDELKRAELDERLPPELIEELEMLAPMRARGFAPVGSRLGTGYRLARPLIIPVRMGFHVRVSASAELPEPALLRVSLFGLSTRECQ